MGSTLADLERALANIPREELGEHEYRRGYADGYIVAVEAMHDLMFDRGLSRQAAYDKQWQHWHGALLSWVSGDCSEVVSPPEVEL